MADRCCLGRDFLDTIDKYMLLVFLSLGRRIYAHARIRGTAFKNYAFARSKRVSKPANIKPARNSLAVKVLFRRRGFVWYRTEPGERARSVRVFKNARDHASFITRGCSWYLESLLRRCFFSEGKQQKQYLPENVVVAAIIASGFAKQS